MNTTKHILNNRYHHQTPTSQSVDSKRIAKRNSILKQIQVPGTPTYTASILEFGAKGDSLTNCKPAFDKAMQVGKENGGIKVVVPTGVYYIDGPIHLVSNVCIEIQKDAVLKFSTNPESYLPAVLTSWEGTFLYNYSPFIYGYQRENITITGEGLIDGNGFAGFSQWRKIHRPDQLLTRDVNHNLVPVEERIFGANHYLRPHLIQLFECKNILIENVKIIDSPFWCIHLLKTENATVRSLKYDAQNTNNDGVAVEYSKNILIEDIDFDNANDNIAIKSGRDYEGRALGIPSENIVVRNCRFKGIHGIVLGSELSGGIQNIFVENCSNGGYCKRGIFLKSNPDRGGYMRNAYFNNITFDEVDDAFYLTTNYHGEGEGFTSEMHDIFINNFTCKEARHAAIIIQGFPDKKVRDIFFNNFTVEKTKVGINVNNAENVVFRNVNIGGIAEEIPD